MKLATSTRGSWIGLVAAVLTTILAGMGVVLGEIVLRTYTFTAIFFLGIIGTIAIALSMRR